MHLAGGQVAAGLLGPAVCLCQELFTSLQDSTNLCCRPGLCASQAITPSSASSCYCTKDNLWNFLAPHRLKCFD